MYITIPVKQVYWYISQVSGERLQDHWSSGSSLCKTVLVVLSHVGCLKVTGVVLHCYLHMLLKAFHLHTLAAAAVLHV